MASFSLESLLGSMASQASEESVLPELEASTMSDGGDPIPQLPGLLGWVLATCVAIGLTLLGAIKLMYSKIESMYAVQLSDLGKQLDSVKEERKVFKQQNKECLDDREQLRVQSAENRVRIETLERDLGMRK